MIMCCVLNIDVCITTYIRATLVEKHYNRKLFLTQRNERRVLNAYILIYVSRLLFCSVRTSQIHSPGMCPQQSAVVGPDHHSDKITTTQIK